MDREAWWPTVPGVKKELDLVTKQQQNALQPRSYEPWLIDWAPLLWSREWE